MAFHATMYVRISFKSRELDEGGQDCTETSYADSVEPHTKARKWTNRHTARVSPEHNDVMSVNRREIVDKGRQKVHKIKPETVDRISSMIFVVLFVSFNVFYWTYFLSSPDV